MNTKKRLFIGLLAGFLMVSAIPAQTKASNEGAVIGTALVMATGFSLGLWHYSYCNKHASNKLLLAQRLKEDLKRKDWGVTTRYNKEEVLKLSRNCFSYVSFWSYWRLNTQVKHFYAILEDHKNHTQKPVASLEAIYRNIQMILNGSY